MNSKQYRALDRRYLWHPYSRHSAMARDEFPVIIRGQGPYLFDCEGQRYFDAISSWWCCNLGHHHPRLVAAIRRQAGKLQHSILGNLSHPPAIALAEKIAGLFKTRRRVFFSSDGASAVEAAIKIAVQYWHNTGQPGRCRLVSLEQAYHGDTLGAVAAGYRPDFHRPFRKMLFPVWRAAAPDCAKCAKSFVGPALAHGRLAEATMAGAPQSASGRPALRNQSLNPCDCKCFESMKNIIERHSGEIAAVIIEPLCQCAAGMRIYHPKYLARLAGLCRRHGILLIADEIAVGLGRTGTMFAFEQAGIEPDIVCLGKGLAGGYLPISAAIVKENIYSAFRDSPADGTFYHGHTFAGNPLAGAAALEVLQIYAEEDIVLQARRKGKMLAEKMAALRSIQGVRNARGLGMIAAFDLPAREGPTRIPAIRKKMLAAGVLLRPLGNTIYLLPPLNTPDALLAQSVDLLAEALASTGG